MVIDDCMRFTTAKKRGNQVGEKNMDVYCQASCEAGSESHGSYCTQQDSRIAPM